MNTVFIHEKTNVNEIHLYQHEINRIYCSHTLQNKLECMIRFNRSLFVFFLYNYFLTSFDYNICQNPPPTTPSHTPSIPAEDALGFSLRSPLRSFLARKSYSLGKEVGLIYIIINFYVKNYK